VTTGVRSGMDWIRVIECWNKDLFYSAIRQKTENMEFMKAMLSKMNAQMDTTQGQMFASPIDKKGRPREKPNEKI
jgi:hypothetical protein